MGAGLGKRLPTSQPPAAAVGASRARAGPAPWPGAAAIGRRVPCRRLSCWERVGGGGA